ncbi:MAG: hypothetical protein KC620_02415 [Myxococcales bacterium]|nr:hypothetical protein [Myxococcales bacterium]
MLGALAASASLSWLAGDAGPQVSADRVRAGAVITLRSPGADAFLVRRDDGPAHQVPVRGGVARFRAPYEAEHDGDWARIECTPLADGRAIGKPTTVQVLVAAPGFGA